MAASRADLQFGKRYEQVAAEELVAKLWPGHQLVEMHTFSDIDFGVVLPQEGAPPKMVALLEVKTRRISIEQYDSTLVAFRKHDAGRWAKVFLKLPTVCLVVFTDAAATFDLAQAPDAKENIVRGDRGGAGVEHALYAHSRFGRHDELLEAIKLRTALG